MNPLSIITWQVWLQHPVERLIWDHSLPGDTDNVGALPVLVGTLATPRGWLDWQVLLINKS